MNSQILKKKVSESLNMDTFPGTVKIAVVPETNLLTVSVTSSSPETSFKLLKSMREHYQDVSKNVLGEVVMEVFGTLNHELSYRNLRARLKRQKKKILITEPAVSFGFVETIVAANLALAMAQRGKKVLLIEGDMRKSSLASFLNVEVPDGTGFSERISHDLESFRIIRNKIEYNAQEYHMKTFLVTSALAGEGKSTVAVNLALSLAQAG